MEQKNEYVGRIERKVKIMTENNKIKEIMDPVAYFNGLDDFMKKIFVEELKEQGFFLSRRPEK